MRYSKLNVSIKEAVLNLKFKKHKNLQIKKKVEDVFGHSLSINSIGIAISRQNKILRSNVFEFDEKKVRKVSDTVIHLIKCSIWLAAINSYVS